MIESEEIDHHSVSGKDDSSDLCDSYIDESDVSTYTSYHPSNGADSGVPPKKVEKKNDRKTPTSWFKFETNARNSKYNDRKI